MSARMAIGQESGSTGRIAESCEQCPLRRAAMALEQQGAEGEAHVLRIQAVELAHKLALLVRIK